MDKVEMSKAPVAKVTDAPRAKQRREDAGYDALYELINALLLREEQRAAEVERQRIQYSLDQIRTSKRIEEISADVYFLKKSREANGGFKDGNRNGGND